MQVHQSCLQRWVDEKQKDNSFGRVHCPQCQTEYIIVFPPGNILMLYAGRINIHLHNRIITICDS